MATISELEQYWDYVDEQGYAHIYIDGIMHPAYFHEPTIKEMMNDFELRDGDVVICTYPKCGTTWMQQIVLSLFYGGDKSKVKDCMVQAPWLEWVGSFKARGVDNDLCGEPMHWREQMDWDGNSRYGEGPKGRRVWKTHACHNLTPWKGGANAFGGKKKCIIVGRNPKDACCSMYHHTRDGPNFEYKGDFSHFSKLFAEGRVECGSFWEWYAAWEKAAEENPEGILWVTYEEMKADTASTVRRVAEFLDTPCDDDILRNVIGATAFDAMKAKFQEKDAERASEGRTVKHNHIRQGCVGTWRKEMFGEDQKMFEEAHKRWTEKTGLKYDWDFGLEPPTSGSSSSSLDSTSASATKTNKDATIKATAKTEDKDVADTSTRFASIGA
mmetsp:Transcript_52040/g.113228  ORF Transcript_52040/g.113228 Transcript_52040/m.113228 type:complete len:384 (-) Transcript_52040:66-1217(-)